MPILLASASPRRRELLARAGILFEVAVSSAEEIHDASMRPADLCEENARLKALAVAADFPGHTVIGADTLVFLDDEPLGKPGDLAEARAMLRRLSGRTHRVCTGVCIVRPGGAADSFHGLTEVTFREFDEAVIDRYLEIAHPLDKAGAYGIQEHGELLVEGIRGSFENVMGLPVELVVAALSPEDRPAGV
jgi:septum formation protein